MTKSGWCAMLARVTQVTLSCEIITALGSPVVPEV